MLPEKGPGELVAVIDKEVMSHQLQPLSDKEIVDIEILVGGTHRVGWSSHFCSACLGQLATAEKDREIIPPTVQGVLLPNLHRVVRQEEQECEWPSLVLSGRHVIHHTEEPAHLSVILHELLLVLIDVAAAKGHLTEKLLIRPLHRRGSCDHAFAASLIKQISWDLLRRRLVHANGLAILPGKLVTVGELDHLTVNAHGLPNLEVTRSQVPPTLCRKPVAPDQSPLRNATVVLPGLRDVHGVVFQVVVHDASANPVVFQIRFHHCFLEIPVEAQHVAIVRVPCRHLSELFWLHHTEHLSGGGHRQRPLAPGRLCPRRLDKFRLVMAQSLLEFHPLAAHKPPCLASVVLVLDRLGGEPRKIGDRMQVNGSVVHSTRHGYECAGRMKILLP
mmetsp:Transcript_51395/g.135561  ORF Transcript_51395/g.135561 Transcript_51395/m.135561 type:complete len:389 (+) Transcript_51395:1328-2494(+)